MKEKLTERESKILGRTVSKLIEDAHVSKDKLALLKSYKNLLQIAITEIEKNDNIGKSLVK